MWVGLSTLKDMMAGLEWYKTKGVVEYPESQYTVLLHGEFPSLTAFLNKILYIMPLIRVKVKVSLPAVNVDGHKSDMKMIMSPSENASTNLNDAHCTQ